MPNQVSAVLGLGALLAVLCALTAGRNLLLKGFLLALSLVLAGQSVLTFSRTGLYCACGSLLVASIFAMRDPKAALRLALLLSLTASLFYFIVFPFLVDYTGGGIAKRFADTGTTGRDTLMIADLELWAANPLLGVGPGQSLEVHVIHHGPTLASHSEFTRLLAEHGVFGLAALVLLLAMAWRNCVRTPAGLGRSIAVSLTTWSLLYIASNGMRLVTPSFVFGLAFCTFILKEGTAHVDADGSVEIPADRPGLSRFRVGLRTSQSQITHGYSRNSEGTWACSRSASQRDYDDRFRESNHDLHHRRPWWGFIPAKSRLRVKSSATCWPKVGSG